MKTKTSTPQRLKLNKLLPLVILIISLNYGSSIIAQTNGSRCFEIPQLGCQSCLLSYPDNSNLPRSAVTFSESDVLVAADPGPSTCGNALTQIKLWYSDEHALTLGVRQVVVKAANGTTTTTNYPVTASPSSPGCAINPQVGTTIQSGDQTGNDVSAGGGRPLWPVIYITDLTVNGASSRIGDWQQGGTGYAPSKVCGLWKAAVRTVDYTHSPAVVTITPDADPATKNHQNLGGGDPFPAGSNDDGYGAEVVWNISDLGLLPGHTYRLEFMVHDGDQNKTGGDAGESCTTVVMPGSGGVIPPIVTATSTWTSDNTAHTVTIRTKISKNYVDNSYGSNAIGWPAPVQQFTNLVNGDYLRLALYDATGNLKMDIAQDYFSPSGAVPSGYKSLGTAGSGHLYTGGAGDIISYKTAMDSNFNDNNYVLTTNSPSTDASYTPNATYPKWNYDVWYQLTLKQSAFGGAGFGYPEISDVHANPSKTGVTDQGMNHIDCPNGTVTLGDYVYNDANSNGHHDLGEQGVNGAAVNLYLDANNDNIPDGAAIATTITDANGFYKFSGLAPGNYIVGVVIPYNMSVSPTNGGDPDNNINDDNNGVTVVNGEVRSLAITLVPGTEPTNDGDNADGNLTLDFALVINFGAIGDFVWDDQNQNGKQDLGEPGLPNVIVKLYNAAGTLVGTTVTDENGEYLFINVPATTSGTSYKVGFSNFPPSYTITFKNKAGVSNDLNSKANQGTGITDLFVLHAGEVNNDIDAGAFNPGSVLAVTLSPLQGILRDGVSALSWGTTMESNLHSFEIERSTNGVDFTTIGSVKAVGNSSIQNNYGYNDRLPMAGANFYRLKVIDANGFYKYSNIIVINVSVKGISVTDVYPNPFADKVQVNVVSGSVQEVQISLVDYVGRTVRSETHTTVLGSNNFSVGQLSTLQKGMYMLVVKAGTDVKTTKLVKD